MEQKSQRCKVVVSACLAGEAVRYDGTDKAHQFVRNLLPVECEVITICPELAAGLGVPRPPVQLVWTAQGLTARGVEHPAWDVGPMIETYAERMIPQLLGISGYIFKARSPSCSVRGIPVQGSDQLSPGLFAARLLQAMPGLPVVEESELNSDEAQWEFMCRVRAYHLAKSVT